MLIDLSDIIKDCGERLVISEPFEMQNVDFLGEQFTFDEPLHLEGEVVNNTKALELSLTVSGRANVRCARCGKPMTVDIEFPVEEILVREDSELSDDEDALVYTGNSAEISEAVVNSFLMNVSGKYLCSEDCKGLCAHCGTNLNEASCDCAANMVDPRWEKLAEIMKNMSDTE